jgi:hypothetical protein
MVAGASTFSLGGISGRSFATSPDIFGDLGDCCGRKVRTMPGSEDSVRLNPSSSICCLDWVAAWVPAYLPNKRGAHWILVAPRWCSFMPILIDLAGDEFQKAQLLMSEEPNRSHDYKESQHGHRDLVTQFGERLHLRGMLYRCSCQVLSQYRQSTTPRQNNIPVTGAGPYQKSILCLK